MADKNNMAGKFNMKGLLEALIELADERIDFLREQENDMYEENKSCGERLKVYEQEDFEVVKERIEDAQLMALEAKQALDELKKEAAASKGETKCLEVTFSAQGHIKQTIEVPVDTDPEELQAALNSGAVFTSIQEGGQVWFLDSPDKSGTVVNVDNNLEYEDFEVE